MAASHLSGPLTSTNGFVGAVTGAVTGDTAGVHTGGVVSSSVNIGSGGALTFVKKVAVSVNPASIATVTLAEETVTVTGAVAGDAVIVNPPTTLDAGIAVVGAFVSAADTVKLRLYNSTGGGVDIAAANWVFTLIR